MYAYELEAGSIRRYIAAESEEHAREIGSDPEQHPDLHFRPFTVRKVEIEGYTITVTAEGEQDEKPKRGKKTAS